MTEITDRLKTALSDRYRIERTLGQGGMATVLLADDVRHERKVAIKVLRPELASVLGAERFVQEIRTTANLHHPNILPLFDSGEVDGVPYYVMPYIQGETLRARLDREGQLGIDEAVGIGNDVAAALDYAHRQAVIHRDIKPENILLHDGRAIVVDFGIALAVSAAADGRMTETGLSLGTPHYMSPEQAAAEKHITSRSDVYSLGAVLYEMLTGNPPHTGSTVQQIIMRIVAEPALPVATIRKTVPPNVAAAVATALETLPADRFTTARALSDALRDPAFRSAGRGRAIPPAARWHAPAAMLTITALGIVAMLGWLRPAPRPAGEVTRSIHGFADGEQHIPTNGVSIAVSRDGRRIAYVGPGDSDRQLWIRERDNLGGRPLPGSADVVQPFFSPDGGAVGFVTAAGQLKVQSLSADRPVTLVTGGVFPLGGAWAEDGYIYFSTSAGLMRRLASGAGDAEVVAARDSTSPEVVGHGWADIVAGGNGVLYTIIRNHVPSDIAVADLATGEQRILVQGIVARYAESGHLVHVREDGALMATRFDAERLALAGPAVILGERLPLGITPNLALSRTGRLLYGTRPHRILEVVWVDRQGSWTPVDPSNRMQGMRYVVLSPDDTRLVVTTWARPPGDDGHLWIKQLPRGAFSRFTFEGVVNMRPAWTPDGRSVLFISDRGENRDVWVKQADGTRAPEVLLDDTIAVDEALYSRDGRWLVFRRGMQDGDRNIFAIRPGVDTAEIPVVASGFDAVAPALSSDGRWLAFVSWRQGQPNVYVRPFPEADTETQVSVNGGTEPVWARDGSELYYRNGAGEMVAVRVRPGSGFAFGPEQVLFDATAYRRDLFHAAFDVSADGSRFVMIRESDSGSLDETLIVVENWHQELIERVGR